MAFPRLQSCMVFFVGILLSGCESLTECSQTGTCTCKYNDEIGTEVDFGSIGRRDGKPKFDFANYGLTGSFQYAFNPCFSFSAGTCKDVVACQQDTNTANSYFDIGDPQPKSWTTPSDGVIQVSYESTQGEVRTTVVSYTCDATALTEPTLEVISESPLKQYNMVIKTCAACNPAVSGCPTNEPSGGLTGGGILCIIFTVLVVVYIVGGVLFQMFARGAKGKEVIPNYSFWSDFPALVKDGFLFMLSPCRRGGYTDMTT